jgi:ABC-type Zn uptake system ZnuABC Zn-binding protein ZnuA
MKAQHVRIILIEDFYDRGTAEMVADHYGAKVIEMPSDVGAKPEIKTYFDLVDAVLSKLTHAVRQG